MVKIAISPAAFEAIVGTFPFPLGSVSSGSGETSERTVRLDPKMLEHLRPFAGRARTIPTWFCGCGGRGLTHGIPQPKREQANSPRSRRPYSASGRIHFGARRAAGLDAIGFRRRRQVDRGA